MTSGYNLQGLIRRNTLNALTQFDKFGYYSENISNWSTTGYKAVRFEEIMGENGYSKAVIRTDHKNGAIYVTKAPLDVAIDGPGFIPVTSQSGEIYYTRDGSFSLGKDGILMNSNKDIVGAGIHIPAESVKVEIKNNGDVYTYNELPGEPNFQGTIPIVIFQNPEGLKQVGNNRWQKTENSGDETLVSEHNRIQQYKLERSNVDIFAHVNDVMRVNASLLASTTLMSAIDQMYEKAINIKD